MLQAQQSVQCPHCFEWVDVLVDLSIAEQSYVEDCSVCCHPMTIAYRAPGGELEYLDAQRLD